MYLLSENFIKAKDIELPD